MTPEQQSYYAHLAGMMLETRGCRFNAAEAASTKDRWSVSTVAVLSVYLLGLAVLGMAYPEVVTEDRARVFSGISAITSTALLVVTLMDFAFSRALRAEKLQQNALAISGLLRELERELVKSDPDVLILARCAEAYERILSETGLNHTQMDRTKWHYGRAKSKLSLCNFFYFVRRRAYDFWYYASTMFIYPLIVLATLVPTLIYLYRVVWPHLKLS